MNFQEKVSYSDDHLGKIQTLDREIGSDPDPQNNFWMGFKIVAKAWYSIGYRFKFSTRIPFCNSFDKLAIQNNLLKCNTLWEEIFPQKSVWYLKKTLGGTALIIPPPALQSKSLQTL